MTTLSLNNVDNRVQGRLALVTGARYELGFRCRIQITNVFPPVAVSAPRAQRDSLLMDVTLCCIIPQARYTYFHVSYGMLWESN
jgi:hypothetical protein